MKQTSTHTQQVWDSGDFAGDRGRPACRVTIQQLAAPHPQYRLDNDRTRQWAHPGSWSSLMFGQAAQRPRELVNVKTVKWQRGVDSDVGTCTIVLANVEARNDDDPASTSELDFPGYYTPNRGNETYFSEWGYVKNEWRGWLQPDRLIRTFEGYGSDRSVCPEKDPYLYPSGVWLIDDVEFDTAGLITITCRDLGRALLDQVMFPPAIPWGVYPLWFDAFSDRGKAQKVVAATSWDAAIYETDSNIPYINSGLTDNGRPLVLADGTVYGHHGRDAFDGTTFNFWVSSGKRSRDEPDAYEYIQGKFPTARAVQGVQVNTQAGPYRMYVSLQRSDGTWIGRKRVPYKARQVDTHAHIPYVAEFSVRNGDTQAFRLPKKYTDIKKVRFTFDTRWTATGARNLYRTKINEVYVASDVHLETEAGAWKYGNYSDYSNIVKWLVCWAGWFWPNEESGLSQVQYSDGTFETVAPSSNDSALVDGRAWGDFEMTATKGIAKLDVDLFDKKPFMDGIAAVREIVGFDFWIDETGGVIWRLPNIFSKGNYLMPTKNSRTFGGPRTSRTTELVRIDERRHLIDMQVKLSSRNNRERIYVGNPGGHIGAVVTGYNPVNSGLRRIAGWTDQRFGSNDEAERMADLLAVKQQFMYRQNSLTITANPALQPDDQIVIDERITGEGYIHRILNISSDFDNDTGRWTYTLTTNWLGNEAFTKLAWDPHKMRNITKIYLYHMGKIASPN